jgi:hypothetical protein
MEQAHKHHSMGNLPEDFSSMFSSELCEISTLGRGFSRAKEYLIRQIEMSQFTGVQSGTHALRELAQCIRPLSCERYLAILTTTQTVSMCK